MAGQLADGRIVRPIGADVRLGDENPGVIEFGVYPAGHKFSFEQGNTDDHPEEVIEIEMTPEEEHNLMAEINKTPALKAIVYGMASRIPGIVEGVEV